jgi:dihydroorotase
VIDKSKTRILAFLNIAGNGMTGNELQENVEEMNIDSALGCIQAYSDQIVGVKIGHFEKKDWTPFDRAILLATKTNTPILVECHLPQYSLQEQLAKMRPGDIITHAYEKVKERASIVDDNGKLRSYVLEANERGILFDLGHGGAGFWYSEAIPAIKQGLAPYSFGTDMHRFSVNAGMKDMLNVMSKFMALGLSLEDVITRATWFPAMAIKRLDLGNLSEGTIADIAVLSKRRGKFGFIDAGGNKIYSKTKLEAELTIRNGIVVWDLNGLNAKVFPRIK